MCAGVMRQKPNVWGSFKTQEPPPKILTEADLAHFSPASLLGLLFSLTDPILSFAYLIGYANP